MKRSNLIQRLQPPFVPEDGGIDTSCLAFGGGMKNGGLAPKTMGMLNKIWSFDYMGSAEFEFGAVPDALQKIAVASDAKQLICGSLKLHYEFQDRYSRDRDSDETFEGNTRVYYLCPKEFEKEVKTRLAVWAVTDYNNTKETILLNLAMSGKEPRRCPCGWIELDNGFMFFTDEKMWRISCKLFGVKTPSKKKVSKE